MTKPVYINMSEEKIAELDELSKKASMTRSSLIKSLIARGLEK